MSEQPTILLAEDREDDIILIQRAFQKARLADPLMVVRDGEEALRYLSGDGPFSDRQKYPIPTLLLLDLHLPLVDGFEVLRWIKAQPDLKDLPVIVLTLSDRIRDVNQAYALGAHSFFVKTTDFEDAAAFARSLASFWSTMKRNGKLKIPAPEWPQLEKLAPQTGTAAYPQRGRSLVHE